MTHFDAIPKDIFDCHIHTAFPKMTRPPAIRQGKVSRVMLRQGVTLKSLKDLYAGAGKTGGVLVPFPYNELPQKKVNDAMIAQLKKLASQPSIDCNLKASNIFALLSGPITAKNNEYFQDIFARYTGILNLRGLKFYQGAAPIMPFLKTIFSPEAIELGEKYALVFCIHLAPLNEKVVDFLSQIISRTERLSIVLYHGGMGLYSGEDVTAENQKQIDAVTLSPNNLKRKAKWLERYGAIYKRLFALPRVYSDTALVYDELKLMLLIKHGAERLLYGSDLPFAFFPRNLATRLPMQKGVDIALKRFRGGRLNQKDRTYADEALYENIAHIARACTHVYGKRASRIMKKIFWSNGASLFSKSS